jgi:asparagine synthase (glutamine-hydrolysing)
MQGICGIFHIDGQPASPATLARMRDALVRTRWATGQTSAHSSVALAGVHWATREHAPAPALLHHDPESGCRIVADARLDDRVDLARSLGLSSVDAQQATDAALILHAWLRWGRACLDRLEGDFAFGIHDPQRNALFLARDRMGVRPLVVYRTGSLCVFASSTASVLAHPQVPTTLDEGRIADFLVTQLEGIDKTSTFHRDIKRLPPAHWVEVSPQDSREQRYWSLPTTPASALPTTDQGWADALTDALEAAVARHLTGADRVGCMVSGGLDSSSLAIIANQQLADSGRDALATFSMIDSRRDDCEETRAIHAMLAMPGFRPMLIDCGDLGTSRARLLDCIGQSDEPFDASAALLHAQYMAAATAGIDAVIDGIDGDSLFLTGRGLARQLRSGQWATAFGNARVQRRMGVAPPAWRALAGAARSAFLPHRLRATLIAPRQRQAARRNVDASLLSPAFARRIDLHDRLARLASHRTAEACRDSRAEALEVLDHPFVTCAIERYHRVAAIHGIQPRHPLTDRHLLALCVDLPDAQRMTDGWSKTVLRRAMQSRLPAAVSWRTGKEHLGWDLSRLLLDNGRDALMRVTTNLMLPAPGDRPARARTPGRPCWSAPHRLEGRAPPG